MKDQVDQAHGLCIAVSIATGVFAAFGVWWPIATWFAFGTIGSLYDIAKAIDGRNK